MDEDQANWFVGVTGVEHVTKRSGKSHIVIMR
jgi:hypothetical protein